MRRSTARASATKRILSRNILAAYQLAWEGQDHEVAEHLLRALEALAERDLGDENLLLAYLALGPTANSSKN